ncbi:MULTISPECIES: monovalent cation/H(+) antiporter subunit G [Kaistia]|uniref:Monovalent cation/H(+) antiporter subunit G n=1 Tax=Kaistia nematophila TaxID=2994654 RepID=A0A9X3EEZ7_9HYPH|nr:monovalent cation/H(+) antiporter subunit G [Kaistia nematophila]MBN9026968.1 cation:proton antiporter [Hyphomicrobiales bacterium]MCX5571960.1 monovalent cation/H(+) antiporter subunit G [Kaistia nematophila]
MTGLDDFPLWAAILVSLLLLLGSGLTLLGTIGLVQFKSFYERIHAPTLGTTCGAGGVLIASILFFSVLQSRLALHELLITVFVTVTTPVTLMLLGRAAIYRDRIEGKAGMPEFDTGAPPPRDEAVEKG